MAWPTAGAQTGLSQAQNGWNASLARLANKWSAPRRSSTVFAAFANVGYCHQDPATDYTHPGNKPSKKGKVNMGDKSPKSVHKQVAQKQVKANAAADKKKQAAAAKQVAGKK
jgi:hypothetical protein